MAVTLVGTSTTGTSYTASSIAEPAGCADGDVAFLVIEYEDFSNPGTPATPSGWTLIGSAYNSGAGNANVSTAVFWRVRSGSLATTISNAHDHLAVMIVYRGADATNPYQATYSTWATYPIAPSPTSLTVAADGSRLLGIVGCWDTPPTMSDTTGSIPSVEQAGDVNECSVYDVARNSGTTGTFTVTAGNTNTAQMGWIFVIQPGGVSSTGTAATQPFAADASGTVDTGGFSGSASAAIQPFGSSASAEVSFSGSASAAMQPFAASGGSAKFPLKVSANARYLTDQLDNPFPIVGDAAWSLISNVSIGDAGTYLDDRKARGFNTILVNFLEAKFSNNAPNNYYGDAPFTGTAFQSSLGSAYLSNAQAVVQAALDRDMVVLFTPAYLGLATDQGWQTQVAAASDAQMQTFGSDVGTAFADYPNIIWVLGGDKNPTTTEQSRISAMLTGIQSVVGTSQLVVGHWAEASFGRDYLTSSITLDTYYIYSTTSFSYADNRYAATPTMPFFFIEGRYENEDSTSEQAVAAQAWWAYISGAAGHVFGDNPIWYFGAPGDGNAGHLSETAAVDTWQTALDNEGSLTMQRLATLLSIRPWYLSAPDSSNTAMTAGKSTGADTAVAGFASDSSWLWAYLPTNRQVTLDASQFSGSTLQAWWIERSTGTVTDAGTHATSGSWAITPPSAGDWILDVYDTAAGYQAPGPDVGTATAAMAAFAIAALGNVSIVGVGSAAMASFGADASGDESFAGSGGAALSSFGAAGTGSQGLTCSGSAAAASFGASGAGSESFDGSASAALGAFGATCTGEERFAGAGSAAAQAFGTAGAGSESFSGSGSAACTSFAADATGAVGAALTCSGSAAMVSFGAACTGALAFGGAGSVALPGFAADASAGETFTGSGAAAAQAFGASALGALGDAITSTADAALAPFGASSSAAESFTGLGSAACAPFGANGVAAEAFDASATMACSPFGSSANGGEEFACTAGVALSSFAGSAAGAVGSYFLGTASAALASFGAGAACSEAFTGIGIAACAPFGASGSGGESFSCAADASLQPFSSLGNVGQGVPTFDCAGSAAMASFGADAAGYESFAASAAAAMQAFAATSVGVNGSTPSPRRPFVFRQSGVGPIKVR